MTHLHPAKLDAARAAAGLDLPALALAAGIREDFLTEATAGTRRLDVDAMVALAGPLGVEWFRLRCDRATGARRCAGCDAAHFLSDKDLAPLAAALREVLDAVLGDGRDPAETSAASAARAALRRLGGGDLGDAWSLIASLDPAVVADSGGAAALARRLAAYVARGDAETVELVGLDIELPPGVEVPVAGWTLGRLDPDTIADFDPGPWQPPSRSWSWNRDAAAVTAWLRRPAGVQPAVSGGTVITIAEPRTAAVEPVTALVLVGDEPPSAISHAWAQPGRGVSVGSGSRELDYFVDEGRPDAAYGPYRVRYRNADAWARHLESVGDVVARAFAAPGSARYRAAAEQMLTVAADFYLGWDPLPRLALEMSTLLEMLVVDGGNSGEVTRRVTFAAAWLGGIDDADRGEIAAFTKTMYGAGSAYRHGGSRYKLHRGGARPEGKNALDLYAAYRLLRRLLLHGSAVVAAGENIAELCDQAQISDAARQRVTSIISEQYRDLGVPMTPFHAGSG